MAKYIEREALLAEIQRMRNCRLLSKSDGVKVDKMARQFPAADVAPVRHGRWVLDSEKSEYFEFYKCSECGRGLVLFADETTTEYPYCNCGAKVDGET